ncbi:MAG TPA: tetratricopeptide repeat protein [Bacteroidota bacterium]|nr:tetratricopeptide repeat protein [Bacteroidota bacterium]
MPFLNAGLAYARLDSARSAIAAFRRAYTEYHVERIGFLYSQIAGVQYKMKDFRRAEESYTKALRYDPGNTRDLFFLAHAREEIRKFGPAADAYRQFLKRAGGEPSMKDLAAFARKRLRELHAGK